MKRPSGQNPASRQDYPEVIIVGGTQPYCSPQRQPPRDEAWSYPAQGVSFLSLSSNSDVGDILKGGVGTYTEF